MGVSRDKSGSQVHLHSNWTRTQEIGISSATNRKGQKTDVACQVANESGEIFCGKNYNYTIRKKIINL